MPAGPGSPPLAAAGTPRRDGAAGTPRTRGGMAGGGCGGGSEPRRGPHGAGSWWPRRLLLLAWLSLVGTAQDPALGTPARVPEPPAPARPRGSWGSWGPWSSCSSSCGDGVALRSRRCLRSSEEQPCQGDPRQYRLCQLQGCPGGSVPFRAMQCSLYNNRPVLGASARYRWVPFHGAPNLCDLNCLAEGHNFYYSFGRVLDGTRCGPGSPDLCVGGRCLSVGCDGILGSGSRPDACGHCGGGHGSCVLVHRLFQGSDPSSGYLGYVNVTKIPAGATNIKVTDKSRNYLGTRIPGAPSAAPRPTPPSRAGRGPAGDRAGGPGGRAGLGLAGAAPSRSADGERRALRPQRGLGHRLAGALRGRRDPPDLQPSPRRHREPGGARAHPRRPARAGAAAGAQPRHRVPVLAAPRAPPARCHQPPATAAAPRRRQPPAPGAAAQPGPRAAPAARGLCHGDTAQERPRPGPGRGCRRALREVPPAQGALPAHPALLPERLRVPRADPGAARGGAGDPLRGGGEGPVPAALPAGGPGVPVGAQHLRLPRAAPGHRVPADGAAPREPRAHPEPPPAAGARLRPALDAPPGPPGAGGGPALSPPPATLSPPRGHRPRGRSGHRTLPTQRKPPLNPSRRPWGPRVAAGSGGGVVIYYFCRK
ncbi:collagen alpha-1(III) chain-like isoform X1 [Prinia subflava]|uniref:collagen alpha-1(III) chain-like isoform X1 n=1 Tax=Prinia subflava TaxID=208062 RepID=UPI002FE056DE